MNTKIHKISFEDGNPTWSPDGRFVLYESDQDGISNIYAFEVACGATWRLTRVVGGASMPAVHPRGHLLLFRHASGRGFDLHVQAMDPRLWERQDYHPRSGYQPAKGALSAPPGPTPAWATAPLPPPMPRRDEPPLALHPWEADRPYRPLETFLPFQYNTFLVPSLFLNNGGDLLRAEIGVGLSTGGADVLGRHAWQAGVSVSRYGRRPNWFVGYQNDQLLPSLSAQLADQAIAYPISAVRFVVQRSRQAALGASFLLTPRHRVGAAYVFERRDASAADAAYLSLGNLGSLEGSYTYQVARRFPLSISPEHGGLVSGGLRFVSRALGARFDEVILTLGGRAWIAMPWGRNQVLALRAATAVALGPDYAERFYLGGTVGSSAYSSPAPRQLPLRGVTGFAPGVGQLAVYAEYRAPIWQIQRGLWTLPVVLRALHGALFVDAGNTLAVRADSHLATLGRDSLDAIRHICSAAGAELRLDLLLGWNAGVTVRLGVAAPWLLRGQPFFDTRFTQVFLDFGTII